MRTIELLFVLMAGAVISVLGAQLLPVLFLEHADINLDFRDLRPLFLFLAMLTGMAARSIHMHLQIHPSASLRRIWAKSTNSNGFRRSVIVSPIVFFVIYSAAREQPDKIVSFCLAFQNGFFWETIFDKAKPLETQ
jgi:hypothetical protein